MTSYAKDIEHLFTAYLDEEEPEGWADGYAPPDGQSIANFYLFLKKAKESGTFIPRANLFTLHDGSIEADWPGRDAPIPVARFPFEDGRAFAKWAERVDGKLENRQGGLDSLVAAFKAAGYKEDEVMAHLSVSGRYDDGGKSFIDSIAGPRFTDSPHLVSLLKWMVSERLRDRVVASRMVYDASNITWEIRGEEDK